MPEVVYPKKPNETWDQVFPIWKIEEALPYDPEVINSILYRIAMNNRFGDLTPKQLQNTLRKEITKYFEEQLATNLASLQNSQNEAISTLLEKRQRIFAAHGMWMYYLDQVFANVGGAYREYKK